MMERALSTLHEWLLKDSKVVCLIVLIEGILMISSHFFNASIRFIISLDIISDTPLKTLWRSSALHGPWHGQLAKWNYWRLFLGLGILPTQKIPGSQALGRFKPGYTPGPSWGANHPLESQDVLDWCALHRPILSRPPWTQRSGLPSTGLRCQHLASQMKWFKAKLTGNPHISWQNRWFPVDFPLRQSMDSGETWYKHRVKWSTGGQLVSMGSIWKSLQLRSNWSKRRVPNKWIPKNHRVSILSHSWRLDDVLLWWFP